VEENLEEKEFVRGLLGKSLEVEWETKGDLNASLSDLSALSLLDDVVGPGPGRSWHFVFRGYEGAAPCASESRWEKR
jgi:hypothetical protein